MTSIQQQTTAVVPSPRSGAAEDAPDAAALEPSDVGPRTRPRTYYWDVTTASWRRGPRAE